MAIPGVYFDGQTAASHTVSIETGAGGIRVSGDSIKNFSWDYPKLTAPIAPDAGSQLRLSHASAPGQRLVIAAGPTADQILARAPHLTKNFSSARLWRSAGWIAAIVAGIAILFYGILTFAPQTLARAMPDEWRDRMGRNTEKSLVRSARQCSNRAGQKALLKLVGKVAAGADNPPDFSIRVYDMKMMNAFAVPGGRMVLTRGLLAKAHSAAEVAGVVAHELGHIHNRHPEAALVRLLGIQLFISAASGGGDAESIGNIAGIATFLTYSRKAEEQADSYAQKILDATRIDTIGLIDFFRRVKKIQDKNAIGGKLGKAISIFSTHPGTAERIKKLRPLPKGTSVKVLTPLEWRALKNICSELKKPTDT